jgi:hypothetical protein
MSTVQQNAGVTVYCPECAAPMHLPSRELLGCKARCWQCQKKVILAEPAALEPLDFTLESPTDEGGNQSDHEEIPEDFWVQESDALQVLDAPLGNDEEPLDGEISVERLPAELRELALGDLSENEPEEFPGEGEAVNAPIVTCGYCQTRIPQVGTLLETDGCPCCGARVGLTQLVMIETQPDWVVTNGSFLVEERVHGPFGIFYHGKRIATSEPITVRQVAADCQAATGGQSLLAGLWQIKEFMHSTAASFEEICLHQEDVYLLGPRLNGVSLADQLVRTRMNPLQIAKLGHDLAKCLEAAHDAGILHRDLKPANVLIAKDGKAKVLGFGLPRRKTGGGFLKGPKGFVMGTVGYLAPEQAQGNGPADPRSDIYSLGVMLFQLLTGKLPFRGTLTQVLEQIATKPIPVPSKLRKELSWEWDVLCRRCTAKRPQERYQSSADLADALQNIARNVQRP